MPLLIDTGGNIGAQSSTVVIRGLNTNEVRINKSLKVIQRETLAGAFLGLMLGLVVTVWAYLDDVRKGASRERGGIGRGNPSPPHKKITFLRSAAMRPFKLGDCPIL